MSLKIDADTFVMKGIQLLSVMKDPLRNIEKAKLRMNYFLNCVSLDGIKPAFSGYVSAVPFDN